MARASAELIQTLRDTADRLENGAPYQWSHMGSCNCGHIAQTITNLSKAEIHQLALEKAGNWEEKSIEYCKNSGYPIDHIIDSMIELGMSTEDIANLEKLSCPKVLVNITEKPYLKHNFRDDVVLYMRVWANMLQKELDKKTYLKESIESAFSLLKTT